MSHLKKGEKNLAIEDLINAAAELSGEIAPTCQTDKALTQADNDDFMTGYLFGKKRRKSTTTPETAKCRREDKRYEYGARDLESRRCGEEKTVPSRLRTLQRRSRAESLRNDVVRLERPSELDDGVWDGPIYARLLEHRHIQPGHPSVFVVDGPLRRPRWLCQLIFYASDYDEEMSRLGRLATLAQTPVDIPYARLTRPS
ncbi:uncharacterized protein IUM83_00139 [Phytophthora cinnamomi]|uniref:uncharacterized protein n=1 Tax=Phytophthora cinnamomi TaxID=4785 RepID=UPI003559A132|nr:hypothetical protein IUM83_00139 [Phytophthora cinnamomi]